MTPLFGTDPDGKLMYSIDGGVNWKTIGLDKIDGESFTSAYIDEEKSTEDYIVLVVGKTEVQIPKEKAFALKIKYEGDLSSVGVYADASIYLEYEVEGASATDEVTVDVLSATPGITAKVYATDKLTGLFFIKTAEEVTSGKVFVFADNNKGKANIKAITLEEGSVTAVADVDAQVGAAGGNIALTVDTNREYNVMISDGDESWLSIAATKATHTDELEIIVAENLTGSYRMGTVTVTDAITAGVIEEFNIVQEPSFDVATDLGSIRTLEDGANAAGIDAVILAASNEGVLVGDENGAYIYVEYANDILKRGDVIDFFGVKKTNDLGVKYVEANSITWKSSEGTIVDQPWVWIGYTSNANSCNSGTSGILEVDEQGVYSVDSNTAGRIVIAPTEVADLASMVGKFVNVKGYTNGYLEAFDTDNKFIGYTNIIANVVEQVTFTENPNWKLSYEGSATIIASTSSVAVEVLRNTVSAGDEYYITQFTSLFTKEEAADPASIIVNEAKYQSDAVQYYLWQQEKISDNASNTTDDIYVKLQEYGSYYTVVIGVSEDGYPTGNIAVISFDKEEPVMTVPYVEDFENGAESEGWRFIDGDKDGYNWRLHTNGLTTTKLSAHSGDRLIFSASYYAGKALNPDNWAFSPAVQLTSDNYLSFWVTAQDQSYKQEHYAVYVFEEFPVENNFNGGVKIFEDTYNDKGYKQVILSLSDFNNKKVYFAIRHFDCTDMFYLNVDDFAVTEDDPTPEPEEIVPVAVPYTNDFSENSTGWQFFDVDGDGFNWYLDTENEALMSESYDNSSSSALTPDNWAFTPPIELVAENKLTFAVGSAAAAYGAEHYAVYITTVDPTTGVSADTATKLYEETISNYKIREITVNIPEEFSNKTAYIAFRHFDCTDQYLLVLDSVAVTEGWADPDEPGDDPDEDPLQKDYTVDDWIEDAPTKEDLFSTTWRVYCRPFMSGSYTEDRVWCGLATIVEQEDTDDADVVSVSGLSLGIHEEDAVTLRYYSGQLYYYTNSQSWEWTNAQTGNTYYDRFCALNPSNGYFNVGNHVNRFIPVAEGIMALIETTAGSGYTGYTFIGYNNPEFGQAQVYHLRYKDVLLVDSSLFNSTSAIESALQNVTPASISAALKAAETSSSISAPKKAKVSKAHTFTKAFGTKAKHQRPVMYEPEVTFFKPAPADMKRK